MPVAPFAALALALPVLAPGFQGSSASGQALGQLPDAGDPVPRDERAVLRDRTVAAGLGGLWTRSATDHAGGVAWIDYNGDHWSDLFIINGFGLPHWLFRNNGDGTFTDVTALIPKTNLLLEEASANYADFDEDGDLDLFVPVDAPTPVSILGGGPNTLYINNGAAGFSEEALPRGLVDAQGRRNISSGLADFDRDGDIDVYCGVWARLLFPLTFDDVLYVNDGSGHFSPLVGSRSWGYGRNALAMLWFDANDDRWPDVYVGNVGEFSSGYVIPENFDVFYTNDADLLGFTDATPPNVGNDASAAMGMDVGDVDNDGDWDLYITDNPIEPQAPLGNVLYLGDGAGGLIDNTCDLAGVCSLNNSWPCNFADFDRDGWADLWVGTTHLADPDHLFINQGDGTFVDTLQPAFQGNSSRGGSIADYDGDGRVDVAIWRSGQNLVLARNESVGANHWLEVKLTGTTSSADAIGATLRLTSSGITQRRRVSGGDSAHSQQELIVHFGLGDATEADLVVEWPGGATQSFPGIAVDRLVFIDETGGLLAETLTASTAQWSQANQTLTVGAASRFGGRTAFDVTGFGPLAWSPANTGFSAVFSNVPAHPGIVTLTSASGASFDLSVTQVP